LHAVYHKIRKNPAEGGIFSNKTSGIFFTNIVEGGREIKEPSRKIDLSEPFGRVIHFSQRGDYNFLSP